MRGTTEGTMAAMRRMGMTRDDAPLVHLANCCQCVLFVVGVSD